MAWSGFLDYYVSGNILYNREVVNKMNEEERIARDKQECPKCGTTKWQPVKCICHRVCSNGHQFRVEGI